MASGAEEEVMWIAGEAQIEANAELVADLRKMVNQEACSDVVFLCKDLQPVYGCRLLLASRSDFFKSMLMNGMAESELTEINLPEMSSAVLLSVFEFLYTGTMLDYPPLTWPMGFEIVIAARFFLLPKLEEVVREFQLAQALEVTDLPQAALMLTEAMEYSKPLCDEENYILQQLVTTLGSNWVQASHACNLSEEAVDYLLIHAKSSCADDSGGRAELPLDEYLRFRQVMLWWICQNCSTEGEAEELINLAVPDEKAALCLWRDPFADNVGIVEPPQERTASLSCDLNSVDLNSVLLDEASRDSAERLLSKILWRYIPPLLLVQVVEPLRIDFVAAEIQNALRFHALRRHVRGKKPQRGWEHGECYTVLDGGSAIQKTKDAVGFAMASVAMPRPDRVYQWSFVIQRPCETFAELGFIYSLSGFHGQKLKLDDEQLSHRHAARVLTSPRSRLINLQDDESLAWRSLPFDLAQGSKVEFCYRAPDQTCSVNIDGYDCGVLWRNLPRAIYYPAVCLGTSRSGRVKIELTRGFDSL